MEGDGNCLYRCIARFIYGTEDLHLRVRDEIYQEALNRINDYPDITIETELSPIFYMIIFITLIIQGSMVVN